MINNIQTLRDSAKTIKKATKLMLDFGAQALTASITGDDTVDFEEGAKNLLVPAVDMINSAITMLDAEIDQMEEVNEKLDKITAMLKDMSGDIRRLEAAMPKKD